MLGTFLLGMATGMVIVFLAIVSVIAYFAKEEKNDSNA